MDKKAKKRKQERSDQHLYRIIERKNQSKKKPSRSRYARATIGDALAATTKGKTLEDMEVLRATLLRNADRAIERRIKVSPPRPQNYLEKRNRDQQRRRSVNLIVARSIEKDWRLDRNELTPVERRQKDKQKEKTFYPSSGRRDPIEKSNFEYWSLPAGAPISEKPPDSISSDDLQEMEEILNLGSSRGGEDVEREKIYVTVGLDFGTSSTKSIIRLPFEAGEPTYAISMPSYCLSDENPHLWQTVVWQADDGSFFPYPKSGTTVRHSIKQDLMNEGMGENFSSVRENRISDPEITATAYLAFVLKYIRGRALRDFAKIFRGRSPHWSVNIGLPTAGYDQTTLLNKYRRATVAALLISDGDDSITKASIETYIDRPEVANAGKSGEKAQQEYAFAVVPETAAQATGFTKSIAAASGLYAMIDVGATTLDACTFAFRKDNQGNEELPLYKADVKPLGVEAHLWFTQKEGKTDTDFIRQCNMMLWNVIWKTKHVREPRAECWKEGNELPVFLMGGGANNKLHMSIVRDLDSWLSHHSGNDGIRLQELDPPQSIKFQSKIRDFRRMTVAWGLSYPSDEISIPIPPSAIDDASRPKVFDFEGLYPSKEKT